MVTVGLSQLPPPPLVEAEEVYSPPPLVDAPMTDATVAPPLVSAPMADAAPAEVQTSRAEVAQAVKESRPLFGVALDVSVPDGAGANVMLRPFHWVELHGGVAHNAITPGFRGGVTFLPVDRWFVPTLTLELGTHPPGDANGIVQTITGNPNISFDALRDVGYDYQNAMLGFTFGSREHFTLYMRGGLTHIVGRSGEGEVIVPSGGGSGGTSSGSAGTPQTELWLPAVKLGFALYFF